MSSSRAHFVLNNPLQFTKRVFNGFRANQGFLLSGAIAYYTLLSIIPMMALILVMLSQFQEPQKLLEVLREYLVLVTPGQVDVVVNQVEVFLQSVGPKPANESRLRAARGSCLWRDCASHPRCARPVRFA